MKTYYSSERLTIFLFFIGVILVGSFLLSLPISWKSGVEPTWIEIIFTITSAVCVVGLNIINMSDLTLFGQSIVLLSIQLGGLGVITLYTLYLFLPHVRISLGTTGLIREFFVSRIESNPKRIIFNIVFFTVVIELAGAFLIQLALSWGGIQRDFFYAFFHSVSAFCNAGFSLEADSLFQWQTAPFALILLTILVFVGGIGFVVISDLIKVIQKKSRRLSLHSRVSLLVSFILVFSGTGLFFLLDWSMGHQNVPVDTLFLNSFFHSVVTRTAGFNILPTDQISVLSAITTILFMFIGGSSGSTAGGVKVTTFVLFLMFLFRGADERRAPHIGHESIGFTTLMNGVKLFVRFFVILILLSLILFAVENSQGNHFSYLDLLFETTSAFCTVGLSMNLTGKISDIGHLVLILAMFIGRVGLMAFVIQISSRRKFAKVSYPEGEVLF